MDLFEAIRTTRAMRRLDPDRDVSEDDLITILDAAGKAPSGGNSQQLRWVVVRDADKRKKIGDIYRECWAGVGKMYKERTPAEDTTTQRILKSADHLGEHLGDAPALLIPCTRGGNDPASVFPAVQNAMLAARSLGLGTTLTTVHRLKEADVKSILDIPDDVTTWAVIPVGYPLGKWGEAKRRPVREVAYWDSWKTAPPV